MTPDVIDQLVGIQPGTPLDAIRAQRQQARDNAQASYLALFEPAAPGDVSLVERFAVAMFVAALHQSATVEAFYLQGLMLLEGGAALAEEIAAQAAAGVAAGPYGHYPAGPLSSEDVAGPTYRVTPPGLGRKLNAMLDHAHLLVFHPRDASPAALQNLLDAGWSVTGIVTMSQLVAFLSFQIRVVTGLQALASSGLS